MKYILNISIYLSFLKVIKTLHPMISMWSVFYTYTTPCSGCPSPSTHVSWYAHPQIWRYTPCSGCPSPSTHVSWYAHPQVWSYTPCSGCPSPSTHVSWYAHPQVWRYTPCNGWPYIDIYIWCSGVNHLANWKFHSPWSYQSQLCWVSTPWCPQVMRKGKKVTIFGFPDHHRGLKSDQSHLAHG